MSKTETARALSASAPSSQLIQQIRALQQQMEQSRSEIEQLPPAIAAQVTEALKPLDGLSLGEIEQLAQIQRTTLDTMSSELTTQATTKFEQSTQRLLTTISQTSHQLESSTTNLAAVATAATTLQEQAQALRPRWWKIPALALSSAILSAFTVVAVIGLLDSKRLALLSADDPHIQQLLQRATPAEYELIREIYSRPGQ